MGRRRGREQQEVLFYTNERATAPGHPFYERLNQVLDQARFDEFCEKTAARFYHGRLGRPSISPGTYFRLLLIGFFEGIDSERGIDWRVADSLSLRQFLRYGMNEATPDHVTVSRTRRLMDEQTHRRVRVRVEAGGQAGIVEGQDRGDLRDDAGSECGDEVDHETGHRRDVHGLPAADGPGPEEEDVQRRLGESS